MAGKRGRYPSGLKRRIVEFVRSGRSVGLRAREFEVSEQTMWTKVVVATG